MRTAPVGRLAARRWARGAVACVALLPVALELLLVLSPFQLLVRSRVYRTIADGDIIYHFPANRPLPRMNGRVGQERICTYFGGGQHLSHVPLGVPDRCESFRPKPDGARLL